MRTKNHLGRIRLVSFVVLAAASIFSARLFFLQVVRGEFYNDKVNRQYTSPVSSSFDRGGIYFSEKTGRLFSAATVKSGFFLSINPSLVKNEANAYQKLVSVIPDLDRATFLKKAGNKKDTYEEFNHRLDQATADRIRALGIKGVYLNREKWRFYPAGRLASQVIGLLAFRGDDYGGRYGLEKAYDTLLRRQSDVTFVNYFANIFLDMGRKIVSSQPKGSGELILTIEPTVQNYLEKQLTTLATNYNPETAGGIIMEVNTGEIAALAIRPNFHPGEKQASVEALGNPFVERVYEMGSVVKPLTLAAAMDAGLITASTTYLDTGAVTLNNKTIRNHDNKIVGRVSMQKVLDDSLNTGAIFAQQKLGQAGFKKYFLNYGLTEKTGIDLPDEVKGLASNLDSGRDVEYATAAFGQGVSWSPISIVRALASLGNGGLLVQPHVVRSIRYSSGVVETTPTTPVRSVLRPETSRAISQMLTSTFDHALVGGKYRMPNYQVAAKTGTAQIAAGGNYEKDRYLHSFFGYFPASKPRFIVFFFMVNPRGVKFAADSLSGPFADLSRFLINYYEIAPDR